MAYQQKILFGSPGTGKSYKIENTYLKELGVESKSDDCIKTVFHPEYTYGDFMGKLLPITRASSKVEYIFYEGHFLKALGQSYKNILKSKPSSLESIEWTDVKNVALIIDEINRGNSSAIFGTVFQLLDRDDSGWSSYSVNLTEIEFNKFLEVIGTKISVVDGNLKFQFPGDSHYVFFESLKDKFSPLGIDTETKKVMLPPNFSIIGSMNTSDNSIYFMDSAFKRRWDWEFIDINPLDEDHFESYDNSLNLIRSNWIKYVNAINSFIKEHSDKVRRIEDKQIGYYFIKSDPVEGKQIRNKLMFFLWDSVFVNDKKPLLDLINESPLTEERKILKSEFVTFGDFVSLFKEFHSAILKRSNNHV